MTSSTVLGMPSRLENIHDGSYIGNKHSRVSHMGSDVCTGQR